MSMLNTWFFLFLSILLTSAVQLDGTCKENNECDGNANGTLQCVNEKCQCMAPWYKPCKTACEINLRFAYQGEGCRFTENCIGNTICRDGKCECLAGLTAKEGACFKDLNVACNNDSECWSNYCLNSKCSCAPGYELIDNGTKCEKKLVAIYNTWDEANAAKAFCLDQNSCIDILAECYTDPAHNTSKFCRCPEGYLNQENKRCEPITSALLSPINESSPTYDQCGNCKADNAACITVAGRRTCWCRAGYVKNGDKCEKQQMQPLIIFPNSQDTNLNNFANNCQEQNQNNLCVCKKNHKFINKYLPCEKIQPKWIDNVYEYGLCTQINSKGEGTSKEGICAEGLKCEPKKDKYICTCGANKFLDLYNTTKCVYYIGKVANTADECPTKNATQNSTSKICQCVDGYKPTEDSRQCELKLSSETSQTPCNSDPSKDVLCQSFGRKAFFCNIGECRCSGQESFINNEKTQCYARVNVTLTTPMEFCPPNSNLQQNLCKCNVGYRPSDDLHQCVSRNIKLDEYRGTPQTIIADLTTNDCQILYKGPVEAYDNNICQCKSYAFPNDTQTGCWYQLNVTLSNPIDALLCPPNSYIGGQPKCLCNAGYIQQENKCIQLINQVYIDKDPAAINSPGVTNNVCVKFFGLASQKSTNGSYCICHPDAYPVASNTYCHFIINKVNTVLKDIKTCPAHAILNQTVPPSACVCESGYHPSPDNQTCELSNIPLIGVTDPDVSNSTTCVNFNDTDCTVKFGGHAFCKDEKCYCNRRLAFKNQDGKCESFSNFKFPAEHELNLFTCNSKEDCGVNDNDDTIICDFLNNNSEYKVCKCKDGFLLDPQSQTCVNNRCLNCNTADNFECRNYQCQCKNGYYLEGSKCVKYTIKLQLYQQCNLTIFRESMANESLVCDVRCERAQCKVGYRSEKETECVQYQLQNDKCVHRETICNTIDENSICDRDKNQCLCNPSFYLEDNACKKGVGSTCSNTDECGKAMECIGQRCVCNQGLHLVDTTDSDGRPIKYCTNGIGKIRFNPVLLLIFVLIRLFFI